MKNNNRRSVSPKRLILFIGVVFVGLILIGFLSLLTMPQKETVLPLKEKVYLAPSKLFFPDEPISHEPIQFSREQKKIWDEKDLEEKYIPINEKELAALRAENEEKIQILLERIP